MSNNSNHNNEMMNYIDEAYNERDERAQKKENRSVMKEVNKELESLKQIHFKDFNLIMADYKRGCDIINPVVEQAFAMLKGLVIKEMFSDKYIDKNILDCSNQILESFHNELLNKLRLYHEGMNPEQYFMPIITKTIEAVLSGRKSKAKREYDFSYENETVTVEDFTDLMAAYRKGDAIRKAATDDACVNLKGFIIYMIMHNFWTYVGTGHFWDMLQCGYMGVIKGMDTYDPSKACATTFFKTYIKCEITRYITEFLNGSTVHYATTLAKVKKAQRHFENIGVEAKEPAIAEFLGISPTSVREALASQEAAINVNFQEEFENSTGEEAKAANNAFMNPERYTESKELSEAIERELNMLTQPERTVIMLSVGFEGDPLSPKQISMKTGMSLDTVKALRQNAINKLHSSSLRTLYDNTYKALPGIEVYEFLPETEQEIDIVEITFEDFVGSQQAALEDVQRYNERNGKYFTMLPDYTVHCNVSVLSGVRREGMSKPTV